MFPRLPLICLCIVALAAAKKAAKVPENPAAKFACGNDLFTKTIAHSLVKGECKGRMQQLNDCCAHHTACYKQQIVQAMCDESFCKCAAKAAKGKKGCELQAGNFCLTAKTFGGLEYTKIKLTPKAAPAKRAPKGKRAAAHRG